MKDSEFINLLNLYLDHEISAADAARLEAEVQSNPERRRVYREYCQMQKACKVLTADFQTEPVIATNRRVIDFRGAKQRQQRTSLFYTVGTLTAAAACIAIVVIGRNPAPEAQSQAPSVAALVQTAEKKISQAVGELHAASNASDHSAPAVAPAAPLGRFAPGDLRGTFVNAPLTLEDARAEALATAAANRAKGQFAWMHDLQIAPMHQAPAQALTPAGDVRPALLQIESKTYNSDRPLDPNVTPMVLRFQK